MATARADKQHEEAAEEDKDEEQEKRQRQQLEQAQQHPQQQQVFCKFCGGAHKYCVSHSLRGTCTLPSHSASKLSTQQGPRSRELHVPQQESPLRLVKLPLTPPRGGPFRAFEARGPCDGDEEEEEEAQAKAQASLRARVAFHG